MEGISLLSSVFLALSRIKTKSTLSYVTYHSYGFLWLDSIPFSKPSWFLMLAKMYGFGYYPTHYCCQYFSVCHVCNCLYWWVYLFHYSFVICYIKYHLYFQKFVFLYSNLSFILNFKFFGRHAIYLFIYFIFINISLTEETMLN